jgi:cysteine desulfurase
MRARLLTHLRAGWPGIVVNGPEQEEHRSPAILSVSLRGVPSDGLRALLDEDGIYVSAASACHSDETAQSPIHRAAGFPLWRSRSVLRFGLSWHTLAAEIDRAAERTLHHARSLEQEHTSR